MGGGRLGMQQRKRLGLLPWQPQLSTTIITTNSSLFYVSFFLTPSIVLFTSLFSYSFLSLYSPPPFHLFILLLLSNFFLPLSSSFYLFSSSLFLFLSFFFLCRLSDLLYGHVSFYKLFFFFSPALFSSSSSSSSVILSSNSGPQCGFTLVAFVKGSSLPECTVWMKGLLWVQLPVGSFLWAGVCVCVCVCVCMRKDVITQIKRANQLPALGTLISSAR